MQNVVYLCTDKRKYGQTDRKMKAMYPSAYFVRLRKKGLEIHAEYIQQNTTGPSCSKYR